MFKTIEEAADCEIRSVIRFFERVTNFQQRSFTSAAEVSWNILQIQLQLLCICKVTGL